MAGAIFSKETASIRRDSEGPKRDATRIDALYMGARRPNIQAKAAFRFCMPDLSRRARRFVRYLAS